MEADLSSGFSGDSDDAATASLNITITDRQFLKRFIRCYRDRPELWDPENDGYAKVLVRRKAQEDLLAIYKRLVPDATLYHVRRKINSLRSNYRKEWHKIEKMKILGHYDDNRSSWSNKKMNFLSRVLAKDSQNETHDPEKSDHEEQAGTDGEDPSPPPRKKTKEIIIPSIPKKTTPSTSWKAASSEIVIPITPQPRKKTPNSFTIKNTNNAPTTNSNSDLLVAVWSEKLRKLAPMQRLFAEKAINDVLFEAELNNLHRNSVRINVSESNMSQNTIMYDPLLKNEYVVESTDNDPYKNEYVVESSDENG